MLSPWIQILRLPNLFIVAWTQYVLHFQVCLPLFVQNNISPSLSPWAIILLISMTVLSTAAGYIINDYYDVAIDKINKPDKVLIGSLISYRQAMIYYFALQAAGLLIAAYLTYQTQLIGILFLFLYAGISLFNYARILKRVYFAGNVVVALLCALVPALIWYANSEPLWRLHKVMPTHTLYLMYVFLAYVGYSFFITLYREIVKDMEDLQGDRLQGAKTLVVVSGIAKAKIAAMLCGFILLVGMAMWYVYTPLVPSGFVFGALGLSAVALLLWTMLLLLKANGKDDFTNISRLLKLNMLLGLIILWFL
ncbi:MAG TPA: hypothetical protein ENJ45_04680 [Phaeodactylibacter sp.]|nr:hypothetical protein [Phaeodactylibacter sp.]